MCGIAGIHHRRPSEPLRDTLLNMAGELRHRGPDGVGLYLDGGFGMVNTRLSIVDPEGGDQPISNETGRLWVMQNGEIYNSPELTVELESLGHRFSTRCDTEVLIHAFEQWGPACLERLNGAFAFAIWDVDRQELFLARDRFGIRPLFLACYDGAFLFASECKALLRHPAAIRGIDAAGLVETFTMWSTAADRSALEGVRELAPAHYLRVGPDGILEETRWWDLRYCPAAVGQSDDELADELFSLLEDSTRLRLRSDVPVGAYMSGGLDSSATAAIARSVSSTPISMYAIAFEDPLFDERAHQRQMAAALDTEPQTLRVAGREIATRFPEVVRLAEKPVLRTAPAPMLGLSKLVSNGGLKVVLTGEGADEFFAGYNIFREQKVRRFWARQPESKRRPQLLHRLYPYLDLGRASAFVRAFFGKHLTATDDPLYSHRIRFENTQRISRLLHRDVLENAAGVGCPLQRLIDRLPAGFDTFSPLGKAQYLEVSTFLQGYLLHSQGDRMLMGNSVEGRFPFLDHRIAEFASRLPDRLRLRTLREKYLLRNAVRRILPPAIVDRPKQPYRAPILGAFFGSDAPDYVAELLSPGHLQQTRLFDADLVQRLVNKCTRGMDRGISETDEMAVVGIVSTMLLHQAFVANPQPRPPAEPTRVVLGSEVVSDRWRNPTAYTPLPVST